MENANATESKSSVVARTLTAILNIATALGQEMVEIATALWGVGANDLAPLYAMCYGGTVRDARKLGVAALRDGLFVVAQDAYDLGRHGHALESRDDKGDPDKKAFNDQLALCHELGQRANSDALVMAAPASEAEPNDGDDGQPADIAARDEAPVDSCPVRDAIALRLEHGDDVVHLNHDSATPQDVPGFTTAGWYFLRGERFAGPYADRDEARQASVDHFVNFHHHNNAEQPEANVADEQTVPEAPRAPGDVLHHQALRGAVPCGARARGRQPSS